MRLIDRRSSARNLPPSPAMPKFAEAQLTPQNNNLMTRNAMGQSMAPAGPRPTAPIINLPQMRVPQTKALPIGEVVLGGGFGQGIVPNSPRPAPTQINMPSINLPTDVTTGDYQLSSYDLTWDGLTPENQYLRPSHNLEIYGSGRDVDISHLNRVRPETMMSSIINHGVDEVFGGSPQFEVDRNRIRPTNPRLFSAPPTVNIKALRAETKRVPIMNIPITPAPTGPTRNISAEAAKLLGPSRPVRMEAQYVAPPVRGADLGGLTNSINRGFGVGIGRAFGADANLMH